MSQSKYPSYKQTKKEVSRDLLWKWLQEDDLTYREIMLKYGYQERLISRLAKELEVPYGKALSRIQKTEVSNEVSLKICSLYDDGKSTREISKMLNIKRGLVQRVLKDKGVKQRDAHDPICYETRRKTISVSQLLDGSGYVGARENGKEIRYHRIVMEQMIGRKLRSEEIVHHINRNRADNSPDNLFLFKDNREHGLFHGYVKKFGEISPSEFVEKYREKINHLYSYDVLYDLYITKGMSCNKIGKMFPEIATRGSITNTLKSYGIFYMREPTIN